METKNSNSFGQKQYEALLDITRMLKDEYQYIESFSEKDDAKYIFNLYAGIDEQQRKSFEKDLLGFLPDVIQTLVSYRSINI